MKSGTNVKTQNDRDEYYLLNEYMDEIMWALEGKCNDIDCDKYMYKELLKAKYKPVLDHNMSCMPGLKRDHSALKRMLYMEKFKRFREKHVQFVARRLTHLVRIQLS
ncbi:MAG: hypothetical protein ABIA93_07760 [Candidatus Woesearchaeota archaeon]